MIHAQLDLPAIALEPQTVNNASAVPSIVDTHGAHHVTYHLFLGATAAACTVLKVQEADDAATWSDITGAALTGSSLPASGDEAKSFSIYVNCLGGRKRYQKLIYTSGSGANVVAAIALMSRNEVQPVPSTTALAGVSGFSGWKAAATPV